jgi:ATP-dependent exoDNAse (exonuclease V) beta subunit (contains helicase and exonuclease domains)
MKALPTPEELLNIKATQDFLISINDAKNDYFRNSLKEELKAKHKELYEELSSSSNKKYLGNSIVSDFIKIYSELDLLVKEWNLNFVKQELTNNVGLFNDIDGDSLDALQRYAVVVDEDNNLVLAGAGSGKTLTVSAKVKYLVEKKNIKPEEILLISFTTKAAEEMKERIKNRLKINIEAKTFHKLGLDIISKDRGKRPDVADNIYLSDVISKYFKEEISKNKTAISDFVTYFGIYLNIPKDLEEFDNLGIVYDHYKNIDFETIKSKIDSKIESKKNNRATIQGEIVRSVEEVIIANFLYLNGVEYTYEKVYPFESDDKFRKRYRPDFYLDDYDIYLEHFGITEDYRVPWLTKIEATKYLDDINWKREFHKENGTTLIETYSYFNKSGNLHTELDKLLKAYNVAYKEVDYAEIYTKLFSEQEDKYFLEFKKLVQSFIGLFKSKGYSEDDFDLLNKMPLKVENRFLSDRTRFFLSIVKPIYIFYQKQLENSGEIDFNDMINMATDIVKNGEPEPLKYIIIDEYQDISVSRFNLIKELKNKTNARVMAVGDDWQSIYRFTGSDIDLFANFSKYLGYSEVLRIERTYRNSQELIDIAGNFIMKNTKQLSKNLTSDKHYSSPIRILGYDKEIDIAIKNAVEEIVYLYGEKAEIMILGRNNFDIDVLDSSPFFKIYRNLKSVSLKYLKYPDVKLSFLTTHRSKGLEADNVIIINLVNTLLGFPNKIADDPILSLVLTDLEGYSFAEERRLFYVAITRTKNSTYLIVPDRNQSSFAEELIKSFNIKYDISTGETSIQDNPNCTKCQKGYFVLRENKTNGSKFLSCTNYPQCDRTLKNIEILDGYIKCNICGGYMVIRHGLYGDFYGCTNYPHYCQNKIRIENGGSDKN